MVVFIWCIRPVSIGLQKLKFLSIICGKSSGFEPLINESVQYWVEMAACRGRFYARALKTQ